MAKRGELELNYPKYLYKFYPLFDDEKLSAERLKVFKDKFFWMSSNDRLNDPTEFEYYYNDQSDMYRMLTYHLTHNHLITCFSKKLYNLPMWSHYANNENGICFQYKTTDIRESLPLPFTTLSPRERPSGRPIFGEGIILISFRSTPPSISLAETISLRRNLLPTSLKKGSRISSALPRLRETELPT